MARTAKRAHRSVEERRARGRADASRTRKRAKAARRAEKAARKEAAKARTPDSLQALSKLAERVDGQYRIVSRPPIIVPARDREADQNDRDHQAFIKTIRSGRLQALEGL
jgi:hypothetical protein